MSECKTCKYWQDYSDRVSAMIPPMKSNHYRNRIELRRCRWQPHPSTAHEGDIYTPENYACCEFEEA